MTRRMMLLFINTMMLLVLICVSCDSGQVGASAPRERLDEWREWLEASDPPSLLVDFPYYTPSDTLLSPEMCDYQHYMIESFVIDDDRVFISDGETDMLVAYKDGEFLWSTGGQGEGPGLFSGIGEIACKGETLAVCNHGVGRIDLFDTDTGNWFNSHPILWPYDVAFQQNGNLVVVSLLEEHMITVISPTGDITSQFGSWNAPGEDILNSMFCTSNRNLHSILISDSILAVNAYYFNWGQIYNLNSQELIATFRRDLPFPEAELDTSTEGMLIGKIYTNDIAVFGDYVAVLSRPIEPDWDLPDRYEGIPYYQVDYSFVDVYRQDGVYIGSFAFPRNIGHLMWYDGSLYGSTDETGELLKYTELPVE